MKLSGDALKNVERLCGPMTKAKRLASELKLGNNDLVTFRKVVSICCGRFCKTRWTDDESKKLYDLTSIGLPTVNIAWMLGRSRESVNAKVCRLRKVGAKVLYRRRPNGFSDNVKK